MGRILGIDLGTTNCVMGICDGGRVRILPAGGADRRLMPAIVAFANSGDPTVGEVAHSERVLNPDRVIHSIKRFVGRRRREVAGEEKLIPYELIGKPDDFVQVRAAGRSYPPQEVCAMILRHLKKQAEQELGEAIEAAVITVPAYFNDSQRRAMAEAGHLAGFRVERIINEPTAAALAYGLEHCGERSIVICHLGGGTFDLTALRINAGEFKVLGVHTRPHFGGDDFHQRISDVVADGFLRRTCIDLRQDRIVLSRLEHAAERAKTDLSHHSETKVAVPFMSVGPEGAEHLEYPLAREMFESICADLFQEIRDACTKLLSSAGLTPDAIDNVVMVGGGTRMPAVQQIATEVFQTELLARSIEPDEVVAHGAALLGGVLTGELRNVDIMDVTSHGIGVQTAKRECDLLIPSNTPIPATIEKTFSTRRHGQTSLPIKLVEGESTDAIENRPLGRLRLKGIRRARRGTPRIGVKFEIDANGVLNVVSAEDRDTGRPQRIVVTGAAAPGKAEKQVTKRDLERRADESEQNAEPEPDRDGALGPRAIRIRADIEQWLQHNHHFLPPESVEDLERALQKLQKAIDRRDAAATVAALRRLDELSAIFRRAA